MKTMRELVEAEYILRHNWFNAAVYYDDPMSLPDLKSMTDEEVWTNFNERFAGGAPVG